MHFFINNNEVFKMKKIIFLAMCFCIVIGLVSCKSDSPFDTAINKLSESNMSKEEYTSQKIDDFENRFSKMELEGGFLKVTHFKSKTQYAYVIEFENESDAQKFYDTVGTSKYDVVKSGNVVVYGESNWIENIKF